MNQLHSPTSIWAGHSSALRFLVDRPDGLPIKGPVVALVDSSLRDISAIAAVVNEIERSTRAKIVLVEANSDNPATLCRLAVEVAAAQTIIAIGGGSTLDAARLCALIATHGEKKLRPVLAPDSGVISLNVRVNRSQRVIAIPTTLGTGAEVSPVACLQADSVKRIVVGSGLVADVALIDPSMTESLPDRVVTDGVIEIMLRLLGPFVAEGPTLALADEEVRTHLSALSAHLLTARNGGQLSSAERLDVALRSAATRHGFAHVGRGPFSSKLWYLATAFTDMAPLSKLQANRLLLAPLARLIRSGDVRIGQRDRLAEVEALFGGEPVEVFLGIDPISTTGHASAAEVAAHAQSVWGGSLPMLGELRLEELTAIYDQVVCQPVLTGTRV